MEENNILNMPRALEAVDGDIDLLKEIAEIMFAESRRSMSDIRESIAKGSASDLMQTAHRLKGSVATFTDNGALHAVTVLEMMGRQGDLSGADEAFLTLETTMAKLSKAIGEALHNTPSQYRSP